MFCIFNAFKLFLKGVFSFDEPMLRFYFENILLLMLLADICP